MWIAAIALWVRTKDSAFAGTDDTLKATIMRDDDDLHTFDLNIRGVDDHERGDDRTYIFTGPSQMPRRNHRTEELPPNIVQNPMPYPPFGFEFSDGINGHLKVRLELDGTDMWIKDNVHLDIMEFQRGSDSIDTEDWVVDEMWSHVTNFSMDIRLSLDPSEGFAALRLAVTDFEES